MINWNFAYYLQEMIYCHNGGRSYRSAPAITLTEMMSMY